MGSRFEPVALFRETSIDVVLKTGLNLRKFGSRSKVQCSSTSALI